MSCTDGSRKKQGAPDSISTNDIGAICALFDMEGALCRLLDLIPETIQKILTFNFADDDALGLFEEILKKAAKKTAGLIYEDLTGRINVEGLCRNPPPPQPEDISYSDVFIFIAELVPILNYFFLANDIVTGNSSNLLDKIIKQWLRKEWFKHCECKPKDPLPDEVPSLINPPVTSRCIGQEELNYYNELITLYNAINQGAAQLAALNNQNSSIGVVQESIDAIVQNLTNQGHFNIEVKDAGEDIIAPILPPALIPNTGNLIALQQAGRIDIVYRKKIRYSASDVLGNVTEYENAYFANAQIHYPNFITTDLPDNCPPPPPPPPEIGEEDGFDPDEFCALFPDDPLCNDPDEPDPDGGNQPSCEIERVICAESYCGRFRKPIRKTLNVTGENESITCVEFTDCESDRSEVSFVLLKCIRPEEPPFQCSDSEQAVRDYAYFLGENGLILDGDDYRNYRLYEVSEAFEDFASNSEIYKYDCRSSFEIWFQEAWNQYFSDNAVDGCMDTSAINYNRFAINNDDCQYE